MKVTWNNKKSSNLYFKDVPLNESFRNVNGRGAVYTKVYHKDDHLYYMLEVQTGLLFEPTNSPVELVDVDVNINTDKPKIYNELNFSFYSSKSPKF